MTFELRLTNLFIAMCKGVAGVPVLFRTLGYKDRLIELQFPNSDNEEVRPELIIASNQLGHALLFEYKSGPNTEADQLRRYSRVTAADLRQRVQLPINECGLHDIVIVGKDEHRGRLPIGVQAGPYTFPILVVTAQGLEKIHNHFQSQALEDGFQPTLAIDWARSPTYFLPIDAESELWEFAELIIPKTLQAMAAGATQVRARAIADGLTPVWSLLGPDYQGRLVAKVVEVMRRAATHEFRDYFQYDRGATIRLGTPTWDVTENPLLGAADKRGKAWKRMMRLHRDLMDHFRGNNRQPDLPLDE